MKINAQICLTLTGLRGELGVQLVQLALPLGSRIRGRSRRQRLGRPGERRLEGRLQWGRRGYDKSEQLSKNEFSQIIAIYHEGYLMHAGPSTS